MLIPLLAGRAAGSSNAMTRAESSPATNQLASFRIEPGFRIELVAGEPMVTAPAAIAFDEDGRLFVAEMRDYRDRPGAGPHRGRVRMLQGLDENGSYESSTVYGDDLARPSAVACYAGGVFVAATPDIFYLQDTNRDGVADIRKLVLTGFGQTNSLNPDALVNSFNWGIDNRIHGVTAGLGGIVTAPNWSGGPVSLAGSDFAFDPRSLAVSPETGPSQSGLSFDSVGRRFTCDHERPLKFPMYRQRYGLRNAFFLKPPDIIDVVAPAPLIFRPGGPVSNTAGPGSRSQAHGGSPLTTSWLTNAQGCCVYRGSAFPTNYLGNVFVADPSAHVVHRVIVRDNGLEEVGQRPPEEARSEFLASSDPSFRPVQVVGGPDGALYIVDQQEDRDHGRLYRIVPANFRRPKPPEMGRAQTYGLVAALAGSDGWHCDTAGRLLYEKQDPAAIGLLTNMLSHSRIPLARLRALRALAGLGALREPSVLKGLRDPDPRVRECAVLLSERLVNNGAIPDRVWAQLRSLADDPTLSVRYQLALTVGETSRPDKPLVLAQILRHDLGNQWIRFAVLSSLADGAGNLFNLIATEPRFLNDRAGDQFLQVLAKMIGAKGRLDEVRQVTAFLVQKPLERLQIFEFLAALGEGLRNTLSSLTLASPEAGLDRVYSAAMESAIDSSAPPAVRTQAVRLTSVSSLSFSDTSDWLLLLCNPQPWLELRSAAVATVAHYDDPGAVSGLLDRWRTFPQVLRNQALASLLGRRSHVPAVLDAVAKGRLSVGDFSSAQLNFLRTYPDRQVSNRANQLFGPGTVHRPGAMDLFKPALRLTGVRDRGRATFAARCAGCHQGTPGGQRLGPNLAEVRPWGKEQLLEAIIEPNAQVSGEYTTTVVQTRDGDNLVGIKSDDNLSSLTLRQPGGEGVVCPRLNVRSVQTRSWSLMPDGLEQGLTTQDMADLLAFLLTATP